MIEDFVQHIWAMIRSTTYGRNKKVNTNKGSQFTVLFERLIGSLWVGFFLALTTPWWIYPFLRREHSFALPLSLVEIFGMNNVLVMIGTGAFILKIHFDANI